MPRGIYKRKQMNDLAPRTFVDTLVAGFQEPQKAVQALEQVANIFQNEANQLKTRLDNIISKIDRINELKNSFQRQSQ